MDLRNKTAIVTGAARGGFGAGFTKALLERGSNVVVSDINTPLGLDTVNELLETYGTGRVMFIYCDVSNEQDLINLFQKTKDIYGHIDIVVNNAGVTLSAGIWRPVIDVNLTGVIHGTQLAMEYMSRDNGGRGGVIVNVASTGGIIPVPIDPVYSATKAGVIMYSRSVAARTFETTDQGIRVVSLCPSFTDTKMMRAFKKNRSKIEIAMIDKFLEEVGMMDIDQVVTAFMKLVDELQNNGGVLAVSPKSMFYNYNKKLNAKL